VIRAESRVCRRAGDRENLVRVGADITASGGDLVGALQEAVMLLDRDVNKDACGDFYGAGCVGTSVAVDALQNELDGMEAEGTKLDASNVLTAAGVSPTPANISAFGACVQKRKDSGGGVPRGTLAYCALSVKGSASLPKAHTTSLWRDRWQTFTNSFAMFVSKYQTGSVLAGTSASDSELTSYLDQYMAFRGQFVSSGGKTSAPTIAEPWGITTTVVVVAGVVFLVYVVGQILIRRLGGV
jgi:hypothetical protein